MQKTARDDLYDIDLVRWAEVQAAALRAGRFTHIDLENVAEEIAALGISERRSVHSHLRTIFFHLLKFQVQPEMASPSWRTQILLAVAEIQELLDRSPSLKHALTASIDQAYGQARKLASSETEKPLDQFPEAQTSGCEKAFRNALAGEDFGADEAIRFAQERRKQAFGNDART